MNCPHCDNDSKVTNSRAQTKSNSVWRRRECKSCQAIWTTEEHLLAPSVFKVSRNDQILDFAPEKLTASLATALRHRKSADRDAKHLTRTIMNKLQQNQQQIIPITLIIDTSHIVLRNYDKLAADLYKATH